MLSFRSIREFSKAEVAERSVRRGRISIEKPQSKSFAHFVYSSAPQYAIQFCACPCLFSVIFCFPQGTRAGFSLDLSGGAEAVPILLEECAAQSRSSPLDDCCTYASSPVLHESVNVEALAFACSLHTLSVCTCKEHCSDKVDNICSVDTRGMAYGEDSALTPAYLAEVSIYLLLQSHCCSYCALL